ncbi:MAG: aminoacyl-tRNA hydrolase [Deltaproteobacteria bacterium]|jgi:PTH1 family peptidyl-tRNA hydrolase|nr:aminoacyl-tRNA hydrolase [Deltaproteobacteria bacterium]
MAIGGLLIGLGNPGCEYARSRHNFGFMLIDELLRVEQKNPSAGIEKQNLGKNIHELWKIYFSPPPALPWLLLKPLTYMNNSGQSAGMVADYYSIAPRDIIVAHDELDLPLGRMRFKFSGGSAGHRGVDSLAEHLGGNDFYRLRLGIGKREDQQAIRHVLGHFSREDLVSVQKILETACRGFRLFYDNSDNKEQALKITREFINSFRLPVDAEKNYPLA